MFLFDPNRDARRQERQECLRIKSLVEELIPDEFKSGLHTNVTQVACSDPGCSPIDTVIHLTWQDGLSKPIGIPLPASEVTREEVQVTPIFLFSCSTVFNVLFVGLASASGEQQITSLGWARA